MGTEAARERRTVADKLAFLFSTVRPPDEDRHYTNAEVARATGISATHIGYLRKGLRDNPSADNLRLIAKFFGVDPNYLLDDSPENSDNIASQIKLASLLSNERVCVLAMRLLDADPSAEALDAISAMVDQVLRLDEGRARESKRRRSDATP